MFISFLNFTLLQSFFNIQLGLFIQKQGGLPSPARVSL